MPGYFQAGPETLFGLLTPAPDGAGDAGVLVVSGGLSGTSTVGRNQLYVNIARIVASDGYHVGRFDYHGMGESTGVIDAFHLEADASFVEDVSAAATWLRDQGVRRMVVLGKCFGSRMALGAVDRIADLAGVVLIGPPVNDFGKGEKTVTRLATELSLTDYARRLLQPKVLERLADPRHRATYIRAGKAKARVLAVAARRRLGLGDLGAPQAPPAQGPVVSAKFMRPLRQLLERGVRLQFVYGIDDDFYADFKKAQQGPLGELLTRHASLVEIVEIPGLVRGFVETEAQDAIIEAVRRWLKEGSAAVSA